VPRTLALTQVSASPDHPIRSIPASARPRPIIKARASCHVIGIVRVLPAFSCVPYAALPLVPPRALPHLYSCLGSLYLSQIVPSSHSHRKVCTQAHALLKPPLYTSVASPNITVCGECGIDNACPDTIRPDGSPHLGGLSLQCREVTHRAHATFCAPDLWDSVDGECECNGLDSSVCDSTVFDAIWEEYLAVFG
jgi:hypothetical protein